MLVTTSQSAMLGHLQFTMRYRLGLLQEEAASGRKAGLPSLSAQAQFSALHVEKGEVQQRIEASRNISARLSVTNDAMTEVYAAFSSLSGDLPGLSSKSDVLVSARAASARMRDALGTRLQGVELFSEGRKAISAAPLLISKFETRFGFPPDDLRVVALSADDLAGFAKATVSEIVAEKPPARASLRAFDRPSVNEAVFAETLAWTDLMTVLAASRMSEQEFDRLGVRLSGALDLAARKLADRQAEIGRAESAAREAGEMQSQRLAALEQQIGEIEGADPYAVAAAANQLSSQLEATHRMMGKLQPLALARFL